MKARSEQSREGLTTGSAFHCSKQGTPWRLHSSPALCRVKAELFSQLRAALKEGVHGASPENSTTPPALASYPLTGQSDFCPVTFQISWKFAEANPTSSWEGILGKYLKKSVMTMYGRGGGCGRGWKIFGVNSTYHYKANKRRHSFTIMVCT